MEEALSRLVSVTGGSLSANSPVTAPKSFYASVQNLDKDLYGKSEAGQAVAGLLGTTVTYANQAWVMPEREIIFTLGSYGQVGVSHMPTGATIVVMQDWEDNGVAWKYKETIERAMFVLSQLGGE